MTARLDMLIVGAGFAGLYMLHKARQLGLNARVLEAAGGVGGTWFHNRYPGARVDIQSLEYSYGFDEDLQQAWQWTQRYAGQPELLRYANHVADRFDLRSGIELNTAMQSAAFDDATASWEVRTHDGRLWRAPYLVMASGGLSAPHTPRFPGMESFKGRLHHTAAWPHEAVDFSGQRVGVIGTGSSGVQLIPLVARQAARLTVFQRTAAYCIPAHNGPIDATLLATVKGDYPGFRARNRAMYGGFGSLLPPGRRSALDVSPQEREAEYERRWQIGGFALLAAFPDTMRDLRANALAAEFVRQKIRATVKDAAMAELLCPQHPIGCKRLCVDTGYYETFNQPHVQLVDVKARPIEGFTPDGLQLQGEHHGLDAVILATGFDAISGAYTRLDLQGRNGLTLKQAWCDGAQAHLGLMVAGFPNLFTITGPGSSAAFTNVMVAIEHHVQWIARCVSTLRAQGKRCIEASVPAQAAWMERLQGFAQDSVFLHCDSWYLGANVAGKPRRFLAMAGGFPTYARACDDAADNGYEGFVLT